MWLFWDVEKAGDFVFDLTPDNANNDLDFTVFKASQNDCSSLKQVRSVLSGVNLPNLKNSDNCIGATGLSFVSSDLNEASGCLNGQDNYVKFVSASKSERYFILINNFSSSDGFQFKLSGSLTLNSNQCIDQKLNIHLDKLDLFPNPVTEDLHVSLTTSANIIDATILDMLGKRVMVINKNLFKGKKIVNVNTNGLNTGTYIMRIETHEGLLEKRFVKI